MLTTDMLIDRRILLEARSLRDAGWDVDIIAPNALRQVDKPAGQDMARAPVAQRALGSVYRLVRDRLPLMKRFAPLLRQLGWRFVADPEAYHRALFSRATAELNADVVIAHDLPTLAPAVDLAARLDCPLIYDSHELYPEQELSDFEKRRWSQIEQRHIGRCAAVVTVNPSIASELEARYGLSGVHVVLNAERPFGGRPATRHFHERFRLPDDARVALLQGGLSKGRNIEALVRSVAFIRDRNVHLVVMGEGPIGATLSKLARSSRRVHLHPRVAQEELLAITAAADIGIIPYLPTSLNTRLATPNKLFEYIAAGIPVLAGDLLEIRRIVEGWNIGTLADMGSEQSIAEAIDAAFAQPGRLATWRDNLRRAQEAINWDREGAAFVRIVEDATASASRRSRG